jgi:thiamine-phosphate pyrophosphorylase
VPALAEAYLAGGARLLQIRAKQSASRAFLLMSEQVVARSHAHRAVVIVNDRADIAKLAGADGVHVGQDDLDPSHVRRILGGAAYVGMSTHSAEQARQAAREPIDYIAVGPVFRTGSKTTGYNPVGVAFVREVRTMLTDQGCDLPLVAIGGITLERAPEVISAGAASVAIISDLLTGGDPAMRVNQFLKAIDGASSNHKAE